jgi:hypothetical protein
MENKLKIIILGILLFIKLNIVLGQECFKIENAFDIIINKRFPLFYNKEKVLRKYYVRVFVYQDSAFCFDFKQKNSSHREFGIDFLKKDCQIGNYNRTKINSHDTVIYFNNWSQKFIR